MNKLRLPGSWKARVQSVAGAAAAAYASSVWALVTGWHDSPARLSLWVALVAGGALVLLGGLSVLLLHRRGLIEFIGPEEEEALRKRRLLTLDPAGGPIRGSGLADEADDTPLHVKALMAGAGLAWGGVLPVCVFFDFDSWVRLFFILVAAFASAAAALAFVWHNARTTARIITEASED